MVRKKQNAPIHLGESLQSAHNEAHHGARPVAASGREGSNLRPMRPPTAATVSVPNLPADQLHAFYRANLQPHAGGAEAGKRISTSADAGSIAVTAEARGCGVDARSAPAEGRSGDDGTTEAEAGAAAGGPSSSGAVGGGGGARAGGSGAWQRGDSKGGIIFPVFFVFFIFNPYLLINPNDSRLFYFFNLPNHRTHSHPNYCLVCKLLTYLWSI